MTFRISRTIAWRALTVGFIAGPMLFAFQNCAIGRGFRAAEQASGTSYCVSAGNDAACASSVRAPTCTFNGTEVGEGTTVVAYLESVPAGGTECQPQVRTCQNGILSGSYAYAHCGAATARSCLFNGQTLNDGKAITAYVSSTAPATGTCQSESRVCHDGILSGTNAYSTCSAAPAACLFDGRTVPHGTTVTAYASSQVADGTVCLPQSRTCLNGALTGVGEYANCAAGAAAGCTFNGRALANGQSVQAFGTSSVPFGQTCQAHARLCQNGVVSGAGEFETCSVGAPAACQINGQTIAHGASTTLYVAAHVSAGQVCATENRDCANGGLSGTATQTSCVVDPPERRGVASLDSPNLLINGRWGIDAEGATIQHAYAPTIIRENGTYYSFFCTANRNTVPNSGWDSVRFATSVDGQFWTTPRIVLEAANLGVYPSTTDRSTCDPSVVKFDGGDGPYYYLYYTGNGVNLGSATYVARARSIEGPYLKFTTRRTWEPGPGDPAPIFKPVHPLNEADVAAGSLYGAGEQTVVVRDGVLFAWFIDDTAAYPNKHFLSYVTTSTNGIDWNPRVTTDIADQVESYDVKVDPVTKQFVMFATPNKLLANVSLDRRFSVDGIHWTAPDPFCPNRTCFPTVANNVGLSGDATGQIMLDRTLVAFGSPDPNYASNCGIITCAIEFLVGMQIKGSAAAAQIQRSPATIPIYRFRANEMHLLTNNFEEGIGAGYTFEQQAFSLYADVAGDTVPVWRCSVPGQPGTFLSRASNCEGFHVDSFSGYVHAGGGAGLLPIYRLYNGTTGDHLITVNSSEANAAGYSSDGVIGHVDVW